MLRILDTASQLLGGGGAAPMAPDVVTTTSGPATLQSSFNVGGSPIVLWIVLGLILLLFVRR